MSSATEQLAPPFDIGARATAVVRPMNLLVEVTPRNAAEALAEHTDRGKVAA